MQFGLTWGPAGSPSLVRSIQTLHIPGVREDPILKIRLSPTHEAPHGPDSSAAMDAK